MLRGPSPEDIATMYRNVPCYSGRTEHAPKKRKISDLLIYAAQDCGAAAEAPENLQEKVA
jgi:hypothetical protein